VPGPQAGTRLGCLFFGYKCKLVLESAETGVLYSTVLDYEPLNYITLCPLPKYDQSIEVDRGARFSHSAPTNNLFNNLTKPLCTVCAVSIFS
jgi:hypothetical protein